MADDVAAYAAEPPNRIDHLGTENATDRPSLTFEQRRGRCFELAAWAVLYGTAPHGSRLVHGSWTGPVPKERIRHAWVLLPDGTVWEPIRARIYDRPAFYGWTKAWDEVEYNRLQAARAVNASGHLGPWHDSRYA